MVKIKALRDCKVLNYSFKSGDVYDVPTEDLNVLVDTGYVEKAKSKKESKE